MTRKLILGFENWAPLQNVANIIGYLEFDSGAVVFGDEDRTLYCFDIDDSKVDEVKSILRSGITEAGYLGFRIE